MATNTERDKILDSLEDEYRHDLAVHLYSTFLLHQLNPLFPRKKWANWPLGMKEVPNPDTQKQYSDLAFSEEEIGGDIGDVKATVFRGSSPQSAEGDSSSESQDEDFGGTEEDAANQEEFVNSMQIMKIRSVSFEETMTNSKVSLLNEVASLIEHRIHQVAYKKQREGLSVGTDTSDILKRELAKKIAHRIDKVFDYIIKIEKSSIAKKSAKRTFLRPLNWQDIVLSSLSVHQAQENSVDTERYRRFYKKCENMFQDVKFPYKYDEVDSEDDLENDIGTQEVDIDDHIQLLEETNKSNAIYKGLSERMESKKRNDNAFKIQKDTSFYSTLSLIDRVNEISWNKNLTKSQNIRRPKKRYRISPKDSTDNKQSAIYHGGVALDESEYIIEYT